MSSALTIDGTVAGQLSISHNTISRKHLTITIDAVQPTQVHNPASRPIATIEDLATKIGTSVNGKRFKGEKYIVDKETSVDITMGKCPNTFKYESVSVGAMAAADML